MGARRLYPVHVEGLDNLHQAGRQVVFHGINKSGTLAMMRVLMDAYYRADRANQFLTTYGAVMKDLDRLREIIGASSGHAFFLAHYLYGSYRVRPRRQVLVTQFRNPIPRARSSYQWLKDRHGLDATFEQWLVATQGRNHTQMQQFAIGFGPDAPDWQGMSGEEMFERAVANIEQDVAWFGLAERFEESIFAMAALCGLESVPAWRRDDRNAQRPLVDTWEPGEVELVREVLAWELRLYEWAVAKFEERVDQLSFDASLGDYREACRDAYKDRLDANGESVRSDLTVALTPPADDPAVPDAGSRSERSRSWFGRPRT